MKSNLTQRVHRREVCGLVRALAIVLFVTAASAAEKNDDLPDPDGQPADLTKPVQVFLIMGQSNTLEMGKVAGDTDGTLEHAVKSAGLYPFMVDDSGEWTVRKDVRNVHTQGSGGPGGKGGIKRNDWLTVSGGKIGIEQGIGHHLGTALDAPVLILKSSIGNRSLGWDLLPPGSPSYEFTDPKDGKTYVYAGYGQSPDRWEKETEPVLVGWQAGLQYDGDVARAKDVLSALGDFYPGATQYEVAGFFWWQGDKDRYNPGHAQKYEENLVNLIKALRTEFDAPQAKFVCATLGQTNKDHASGTEKNIIDAQLAVSDPGRHPEFNGTVATVYTHPLSQGGASNSHYNGNAKTYMNVGLSMGKAMVDLLKGEE